MNTVTDFVFGFGKVTASAIANVTKEVVYQVAGILGFDEEQTADKQVGYGGLGVLSYPLPGEVIDKVSYDVDVVYVKQGDELVPVAWRDLRLNRAFPSGLKPGQIAFAGYGGGFYSLDLTSGNSGSQKANIHVLYCPYDFDSSGVPQKAHTITLDPDANIINLLHADGGQFVLLPEKKLMMISDDATWASMEPGKFEVQAIAINLIGTVAIGNPVAATPILPALATLGSPRLLYSVA
jgi:hypothetical protein